jgi:hypothetical protein
VFGKIAVLVESVEQQTASNKVIVRREPSISCIDFSLMSQIHSIFILMISEPLSDCRSKELIFQYIRGPSCSGQTLLTLLLGEVCGDWIRKIVSLPSASYIINE